MADRPLPAVVLNKVGGVVVTGNEDGAHAAADTTLFNLSPYLDAGGADHPYTERTTEWMAHNTVHLARILRANPIPPEGNTMDVDDDHRPHIG